MIDNKPLFFSEEGLTICYGSMPVNYDKTLVGLSINSQYYFLSAKKFYANIVSILALINRNSFVCIQTFIMFYAICLV
jgi:hypothetical protein